MKVARFLIILLLVAGMATFAYCETATREAKLIDMQGSVTVRTAGGEKIPGEIGMTLHEGDIVKTGADSFALVKLEGSETATVEVNANAQMLLSELQVDEEAGTQTTLLDLAIGKILIKADKVHNENSKFEVKTPTSVVGVRGTTFAVEVEGLE